MEILTFDLSLSDIIPFDPISFKNDPVYLWVWHADKIPPHIGISSQGHYFSLKSNGKDESLAIDRVRNIILQKKIKTLVFELDKDLNVGRINKQFDLYSKTVPNQTTCLQPISELLNYPGARLLKELLAELRANNKILKTTGFNIEESFKGIQDYTTEDIYNRLRKLEND